MKADGKADGKIDAEIDGAAGETRRTRHWGRRFAAYAAVALLAVLLAVIFVRTRYDKVVSHARPPATDLSKDRR